MFHVQSLESVTYLWWTAMPKYDWEPVLPAPEGPAEGAAAPADAAAQAPLDSVPSLPAMRLVFKGMQWVLVPIQHARPNPTFDQATDDQQTQDRWRGEGRKAPVAPPATKPGDVHED